MAATGFGRVGRELALGLIAVGVEVRILAINWRGREGELAALLEREPTSDEIRLRLDELDADPLTPFMHPAILPGDGLGTQLTSPAARGQIWKGWEADRIIVVADPRALLIRLARDGGVMRDIPTFNYVPIEGDDLPPFDAELWKHVEPVAMSLFGKGVLETLLSIPVAYVPHGVSQRFHPVSSELPGRYAGEAIRSKDEAKAAFGWQDRKVILRTDRFVERKDYPGFFRALGPVLSQHHDALLVVHCAAQDEGGWLPEIISKMPGAFHTEGRWQHPQVKLTQAHDTFRGLDDDELNVLYNAADVYASNTMAEGFGLCLAEAAQCAVPVVTTDYAAGPEVVGPGALLARVRGKMLTKYAVEWAFVDEQDFAAKVDLLLREPERRERIGLAGAAHVAQFTWERTVAGFLELLGAAQKGRPA
jgi:glycosyltransferase involved in cell wall biosynthesis